MKNQKIVVKTTKVVVKPKVAAKKVAPKSQEPTYKNLRMGVNAEKREMTGQSMNVKPSKKDSMAYKAGYNIGLRGGKGGLNESPVVKMGRWEGQNMKAKPAAAKKK